MLKFILVRHGETLYNKEHIFRGTSDIPLNERGRKQAARLADALKEEELTAIYSSPQLRARETALEIGKHHNLDILTDQRLADMNFGSWQGKSVNQVKEEYPELYSLWIKDPFQVKLPEGENLNETKKNLRSLFLELEKEFPDGTVTLVTHRLVVKVILLIALGIEGAGFWKIKPDVASISRLEKYPRNFVLTEFNETCHLKEESSGLPDF